MIDLRPVGYVIGLLVALLGITMLIPMAVDYFADNGHAGVFFESAILTVLTGGLIGPLDEAVTVVIDAGLGAAGPFVAEHPVSVAVV